jgi:2-keto-4-pentenoate hydratase
MSGLTGSAPPCETTEAVSVAEQAARLLREARRTRQPIEALPNRLKPLNLSEAYAIQRAFVAASGARPVGYKVGLTSKRAQQMLNADAPVWGTVLEGMFFDAPATLSARDFVFCAVEPEVAVVLGSDLPARDRAYTVEEVAQATARIHPAMEVVTSAYGEAWTRVGLFGLAADNGVHGCLVLGEALEDWRGLDLAGLKVEVDVDGKFHSDGKGENALGGAMQVVAWLANALPAEDLHLKAGDVITTGVVTGVPFLQAGQKAEARFEGLGDVKLRLE